MTGQARQLPASCLPWYAQAACRGKDAEVWHPTRNDRDGEAAAKAICAVCPVRQECLDHALANREALGIWSGLNTAERFRLLGRRLPIRTGDHGPRRRVTNDTGADCGAPGRTHGTISTYNKGCRCDLCRAAATEAKRQWRTRQVG